MISIWTAVFCVVTLLVCMAVPVAVLAVFAARNKRQGIVSAWFLGAAGFFVPQVLIRLPILQVLSGKAWFASFSQSHLFLYTLSLAFTAGLFELAGRFAAAKIMEKKLTFRRSLAAGLGHGGIEAMLLIGTAYINNLVFIVMLNTGTFDALASQLAAAGQDPAMLETIRTALLETPPATFLLSGFERILTMTVHAGMSVLVCWGVHTKRPGRAALGCLGIHTLVDLTAGISLLATEAGGNYLSQGASYALIYTILAAAAVLSVLLMRSIRRRWEPETEGTTC